MTPFFDGDRAFTTCAVPSLGKAKSSTADSSASAAQRSFHQIARRVRPGGHLINADLASSLNSSAFESLSEVWLRAHGHTLQVERPAQIGWGKEVAVSRPEEIESIIAGAGFEGPILFYQALFIHAWHARSPSGDNESTVDY
jgi:tRNA (cmo5U34)-methyltransferase